MTAHLHNYCHLPLREWALARVLNVWAEEIAPSAACTKERHHHQGEVWVRDKDPSSSVIALADACKPPKLLTRGL